MIERTGNRKPNELRPLSFEANVNRYAEGSVLVKAGQTHVLCTATIEENVPPWLEGRGKGWVTAEYSMLPRSTHTRCKRERGKVSGRTQEIQRLIARALRGVVDLSLLGERSIMVDCDVLQADGGTRTASITGGCIALAMAIEKLRKDHQISKPIMKDTVCAVSLGLKKDQVLVDLDYDEDSSCDVDMNFVMTGNGEYVELQGTGEKTTFSKAQLSELISASEIALNQIKDQQFSVLRSLGISL